MTEEIREKVRQNRILLKEKAPIVYKLFAARKLMESSIESSNMRGSTAEADQPIAQQLQGVKK